MLPINELDNIKIYFESIGFQMLPKLVLTVAIVVIISFVRFISIRLLKKYVSNPKTLYLLRKWISSLAFIIAFFMVISVWIKEFQSIFTFLGLLSAGIAIALREPVANFFGWIYLVWRHPFRVGDRVQVEEYSGDVVDIGPFQFTIMEIGGWIDADQHSGRQLKIPNSKVFNSIQVNYSGGFPFVWNEIHIPVSFESNWRKAREVLQKIANEKAPKFSEDELEQLRDKLNEYALVNYHFQPRLFLRVIDNGVRISIRYLARFNNKRGSEQAFWDSILEEFASQPDLMFAYPTQRFFNASLEAKPELRPENKYPEE